MATAAAMPPRQGAFDEAALPIDTVLDRRRPVADQVYDGLRDAIVTVRLMPGTALSENRICRHFGVSRTPARAAILRLAEEGLIDVYPQQGSFVAPIRLNRLETSRFVRRSLEASIVREAAGVWTAAMGEESRAIIQAQREAIATLDIDLFYREDMRFHEAFCRFVGRDEVWETIAAAFSAMGRLARLNARPERLPVVLVEHAAIIEALDARDEAEAARRLEVHVDQMFAVFGQVSEQARS